jgi:hypothetical protein
MCDAMNIGFDPGALSEFVNVTAMTGNLTRVEETQIAAPKRSAAALLAEKELSALRGYDELLTALGYTTASGQSTGITR